MKPIDMIRELRKHVQTVVPLYSTKILGSNKLTINYGKRTKRPRINLTLRDTIIYVHIRTNLGGGEHWERQYQIDLNDPNSIDQLTNRLKDPHHA